MLITPPDIAICFILGFFSFNGFRHGFIEEMARLISLVCGFVFASKFHNLVIPYLKLYIEEEAVQVAVSYLGIFVVSVIIITILAKIIQKFIEMILLGWINRILGLLLGLLKGFLIVSLIIFVIQAIPLKLNGGETIRNKLKKESIMYQVCDHLKELIIITVPMENQINLLEDGLNIISNEKTLRQKLKSP